MEEQLESLLAVGSYPNFSLEWSGIQLPSLQRQHRQKMPSSGQEGEGLEGESGFPPSGGRQSEPGFSNPSCPSRTPIPPRTSSPSFHTSGIDTQKPPSTNCTLFCVCFCFAVMPLTWIWPVCVFVHRIFIFIQFLLLESARSMMHLLQIIKEKKVKTCIFCTKKDHPLLFLFTRCFVYVCDSNTLPVSEMVPCLHDVCAHLLSMET